MAQYKAPPEVDIPTLRRQAARRRAALKAAGCSTYTLGYRQGVPSIACLCCGLRSMNPNDIANRYCGLCKEFHSEWSEAQTS